MLIQMEQPKNVVFDVDPFLHLKPEEVLEPPVSVYVNEFCEESVKIFLEDMTKAQNTSQPIIPVYIDSYGGDVYALMAMIDIIKSSDKPVATICLGKAMSCGAVLLACGEKGHRYVSVNSTVMIHDVSSIAFGKVEDLKADVRESERLNKKVYEMMAKNCGKESNYFLDIVHMKGHADWYLDVEEGKRHGLVNHSRLPTLTATVDVKFGLE